MRRRPLPRRRLAGAALFTGAACALGVTATPSVALGAVQEARVRAVQTPNAPDGPGWLGLSLREFAVPPGVAGAVNGVRLVVTDLFHGGPAERSGLRPGDVLVRLNGAPAEFVRFRSLASRLLPGDPLALTVLRDDRMLDLSLEAGRAPERGEIVRQVVQVHLDSARIAFAPRLDSLHAVLRSFEGQLDMLSAAPRVELMRVQGDSLQTMVVVARADGSTVRLDQPRGASGTLLLRTSARATAGSNADEATASSRAFMLRSAAADAARPTRFEPDGADAARRPLLPYITGANRVAGAEWRRVDAALGAYFGVSRGVLVLDVAEGTPARRAGLQPGDVILRLGDREVSDVETLRIVLARSPGPVSVELVRRGRPLKVILPR